MPGYRKRKRRGAAWRWRRLDEFDPGLRAAIEAMGSATNLAKAIGVAPQAIAQWRRVPHGRIIDVEHVTGIDRSKLRPELYRR